MNCFRFVCVRLLLASVRDDEVVEFVESVFDEVEELEVEFRERAKQSECVLRGRLLQRIDRLVFDRDFLAFDFCESIQTNARCRCHTTCPCTCMYSYQYSLGKCFA